MKRRNFVLGIGGASVGGSALLGTGAFSRVESQRDVTIAVAEDPDAYLGLSGTGSINSENYMRLDEKGHIAIDVGENPNDGLGVNSDSFTWFDSMIQVCNQGKEGVEFYIEEPGNDDFPDGIDATGPAPYDDEPRLQFYTGEAAGVGDDGTSSVMGKANAIDIPVGECIELGVRTMTKGVNANDGTLFSEEVQLIADVAIDEDPFARSPEPSSLLVAGDDDGDWAELFATTEDDTTTFIIEIDDDEYLEWPQNTNDNWFVEFSFRIDSSDPVDAYRIGWTGNPLEDNGRDLGPDIIDNEGYARINFGSNGRADFKLADSDEITDVSASANAARTQFRFEVDWANVTLGEDAIARGDTDVENADLPTRAISAVPSDVEINELFGTDAGNRGFFEDGGGLTIDPSS
jgi:hypothetical protein